MPILNFQRRFVPKILAETKVHTIRVMGTRKFRPGNMLYMQTGPRFAPERFAVNQCLRVREIRLFTNNCTIWHEDDSGFIMPPLDRFARADGFENWAELQEFFKGRLDGVRHQLIQWAPAEWE